MVYVGPIGASTLSCYAQVSSKLRSSYLPPVSLNFFLPPSTTGKTQPLVDGSIANRKHYFSIFPGGDLLMRVKPQTVQTAGLPRSQGSVQSSF